MIVQTECGSLDLDQKRKTSSNIMCISNNKIEINTTRTHNRNKHQIL